MGRANEAAIAITRFLTHESDADFKGWAERARTPFVSDSRIHYYELVDLKGVRRELLIQTIAGQEV